MAKLDTKRLLEMLSNNKVEEVLTALKDAYPKNNTVINISGQFASHKKSKYDGTASSDDLKREINQIRLNLLDLINDLTEDQTAATPSEVKTKKQKESSTEVSEQEFINSFADEVQAKKTFPSRQISVSEIKEFTKRLSATTSGQELGDFMFRLAQVLKKTNKGNDIPGLLPAAAQFIFKLHEIVMDAGFKSPLPGFIDLFLDISEKVHDIILTLEWNNPPPGKTYTGMNRLGLDLEKLASYLLVIVPLLVASRLEWLN
ncbi:MAG: hypothetical protein H6574_18650 [Lewinellaceae bacterium]|nr:hypothetical protein [Lewinellaceae bacterium]MCB9333094.1 hypothetical protein [Lewinellaceae bacterium]